MNLKILIVSISCFVVLSCQEKEKTTEKKAIPTKPNSITKSEEKKEVLEQDTITIDYLYEVNPYDYDTQLSNGYNLAFSYFRNDKDNIIDMCLNLRKGEKLIDTLNVMGYGAPHKNLGYIGADFNDYFAFVNSFGSGNPHEFRLIRKNDGKTIKTGFIINSFKKPELLLYANDSDSLMLYDIEKNKDNYIENLTEAKELDGLMISQLDQALKIKKATNTYVLIEIENRDSKKITKRYSR